MQIYLITNRYNQELGILPYLYIGSDTKDRSTYFGSSKSLQADIGKLGSKHFHKAILWQGSISDLNDLGYTKLTELECNYQTEVFDITDERFYNKATAVGKFTTQGTANYRYINDPTNMIVNLHTNHPDVVSGLVVGMNTGNKFNRSAESLQKSVATALERYGYDHPSKSLVVRAKLAVPKSEQCRLAMKKPKSEQHKLKMRKPKTEAHKQHISDNHRNNTSVVQYDLNLVVIQEFPSLTIAGKTVYPEQKFPNTAIGKVCRGLQPSYRGFIWRYKDVHPV